MFDEADRFQPWRVLDSPRPVWVDPARLWGPTRTRWGKDTPIWLRKAGLDLRDPLPGLLFEWWQTMAGDWCGLVTVQVRVGGEGEHTAELTMLLPESAIRKRD